MFLVDVVRISVCSLHHGDTACASRGAFGADPTPTHGELTVAAHGESISSVRHRVSASSQCSS